MSIELLMLGDSLTEYGDWDVLLKRDAVQNHGIAGDTTQGVLERLAYVDKGSKAFIMLGINDILTGREVSYIVRNYRKILKTLQEKKCEVYIQSTLYTGNSIASTYKDKVLSLNTQLKDYTSENGMIFIDLNVHLSDNGVLIDRYGLDDVHLNNDGYLVWAKVLKRYVN